jgi:hypothetical protein
MTYHVLGFDKDLRPTTVGLQSVYYMNGTRTLSDLVTYTLATKEKSYTDGDPDPSSVEFVAIPLLPAEGCYDLQGRPVSQPQKGIYLKTVRQADGNLRTIKVLK